MGVSDAHARWQSSHWKQGQEGEIAEIEVDLGEVEPLLEKYS